MAQPIVFTSQLCAEVLATQDLIRSNLVWTDRNALYVSLTPAVQFLTKNQDKMTSNMKRMHLQLAGVLVLVACSSCADRSVSTDPAESTFTDNLPLKKMEKQGVSEGGAANRAAILQQRAKLLLDNGHTEEAIHVLVELLKTDPKNADAHTDLGLAYQSMGRLDEAGAQHRTVLELHPDNADAHNNLGIVFVLQQKPEEAIQQFQLAIESDPKDPRAHDNIGMVLQEKGRFEEALAYHKKALNIDANYAQAHQRLGNALRELGRLDEALAHCREALRIKPDNKTVHRELGIILAELGHMEEAKPHLTQGLPEVAVNFTLGQALLKQKHYEAALPYYSEVLRIKPKHAKTHRSLATALAALGRFDEAVTHDQEALQLEPNDAQAHVDLATNLERLARYREAVTHWKRALELVPDNMGTMNNLAWLLATCPDDQCRDGKEAVRLAEAASRLTQQKNAFVLGTLAASNAEVGNFKEAVTWQKKAIELIPQDQKDNFHRRLELYEAGKPFRQDAKSN